MGRRGELSVVASSNPAANTEFSVTVPASTWYALKSVSVSLAQGATQTPWPSLIIDDGTNVLWQGFAGTAAMNASVTGQFTWAPNLPALGSGASTVYQGPLPDGLILAPGYRVRSSTTGIGANSDYGIARLWVVTYSGQPMFE